MKFYKRFYYRKIMLTEKLKVVTYLKDQEKKKEISNDAWNFT